MFGTIHVPYTRVWDSVPENAKSAFVAARQAYFELDLTDHATLAALSSCQLLPRGQHISRLIPRDLYMGLRLHLDYVRRTISSWITDDQRAKGLDSEYLFAAITANWERKQPVWVMLMVSTLNAEEIASRGIPVLDLYLLMQAEKQKKRVHAIERPDEHCNPLNELSLDMVIFALNETLKEQDNLRLGIRRPSDRGNPDTLIQEYRQGSLDATLFNQDTFQFPLSTKKPAAASNAMARRLDDYFKTNLIQKRNKRMAARVIDLLVNRPDAYFFAFGVGHFIGVDNILEFIRSAGYTVDHVAPGEVLDFSTYSNRKHTVQGTFDDLSEDEKTRALLQFLQYHQQLEGKSENGGQFKDLVDVGGGGGGAVDVYQATDVKETMDEKAVEESLKVWYGLTNGGPRNRSVSAIWIVIALAMAMLTTAAS